MAINFNPSLSGVGASGSVSTSRPAVNKTEVQSDTAPPSEQVTLSGTKAPTEKPAPGPASTPQAPAQAPSEAPSKAPAEQPAPGPGITQGQGGTLLMTDTPAPPESASIDGCLAKLAGLNEIPTITAGQVNWDSGANVVSNAQKFVIPVPNFEGEALVYPDGAKDKEGKDIGGTSIKDWQGQPIGDKGLVFFNQKDQAWQAVKSDGQGVIIMNQMTEDQGKALMNKIGGDPSKLTLDQLKEVLTFAATTEYNDKGEVTREGCKDMYNSDRSFISKKMNALETLDSGIPQYGMFRRDDRDVCKALLAEGPSEFEAPTTGGITVKQPIPEEGGILVRQPDGTVFLYRKVDLDVFVDTYTIKDGSKVVLDELPRHKA